MPVVLPARDGHRRRFSDAQRAHILAEAARPGASVSEVARRFGIARRVLYLFVVLLMMLHPTQELEPPANLVRFKAGLAPVVDELQRRGVTTLRGLSDVLNARGMMTGRGGRWQVSNVRKLLARKRS